MHKAREHKFFDFHTFNVEEYEHYEQVEVRNVYLNSFIFVQTCFVMADVYPRLNYAFTTAPDTYLTTFA